MDKASAAFEQWDSILGMSHYSPSFRKLSFFLDFGTEFYMLSDQSNVAGLFFFLEFGNLNTDIYYYIYLPLRVLG